MEWKTAFGWGIFTPTLLYVSGGVIIAMALGWTAGAVMKIRSLLAVETKDLVLSQAIVESLDEETQEKVLTKLKGELL
jgi:hypothetical protein